MPVSESCRSCASSAACHVRVGLRPVARESPIPARREGQAPADIVQAHGAGGDEPLPYTASAVEKSGTPAHRPCGASPGQVQSRPSAGRPLE